MTLRIGKIGVFVGVLAAVGVSSLVAPWGADLAVVSAADAGVVSVVPARLLETRPGELTIDGVSQGEGRRLAGSTYELTVTGAGGVPVGAAAVMLNVTAVFPSGPGFLTVFPCGTPRPNASNVNYGPNDVVPNMVFAKVGTSGKVCIYTLAESHLITDVTGYVPTGGSVVSTPTQCGSVELGDNGSEFAYPVAHRGMTCKEITDLIKAVHAGYYDPGRAPAPFTVGTFACAFEDTTSPGDAGFEGVYRCSDGSRFATWNFSHGE